MIIYTSFFCLRRVIPHFLISWEQAAHQVICLTFPASRTEASLLSRQYSVKQQRVLFSNVPITDWEPRENVTHYLCSCGTHRSWRCGAWLCSHLKCLKRNFALCLFVQVLVQKIYMLLKWWQEHSHLRMRVLKLILWTFCSGPSGI